MSLSFRNKGPSRVRAASLAPKRKLPPNSFGFPSLCSNAKTPDNGLSYSAPKEELDRVTSRTKETLIIPTGPPALPCVLK